MAVEIRSAAKVSPNYGNVADQSFHGSSFRVNVSAAQVDAPPPAPAEEMPAVVGAGVNLAKWVLVILAIVLGLLISASFWQEQQFSSILATSLRADAVGPSGQISQQGEPDQLRARQELLKAVQEVADASREFWLKLGQMILLNLLLPILTALLGYVFGSRHGKNEN